MRVSLNTMSMNNSQPLRFKGCCDKKPSFNNNSSVAQSANKSIDYKSEYQKAQAQLDYLSKKYEVLCNVCALGMNPKFK